MIRVLTASSLVLLALGSATFPPDRRLDLPHSHPSLSNAWTMVIRPDPTTNTGSAQYHLNHDDHGRASVAWHAMRPFHVLHDVSLTDKGWLFGMACRGLAGSSTELELLGVSIGPDGTVRVEQSFGPTADATTGARPRGVVIHDSADRVVFCVGHGDSSGTSTWHPFEIASGKALPEFDPAIGQKSESALTSVLGVIAVPKKSMFLVRWQRDGSAPSDRTVDESWKEVGSRFALINTDGTPVWSIDEPADLGAATYAGHLNLRALLNQQQDAGLRCDPDGRSFTVRLIAKQEDVTYTFRTDDKGKWNAKESKRTPVKKD